MPRCLICIIDEVTGNTTPTQTHTKIDFETSYKIGYWTVIQISTLHGIVIHNAHLLIYLFLYLFIIIIR